MKDNTEKALTHSLGVEFDRLVDSGAVKNSALGKRIQRVLRTLPNVEPRDFNFVREERRKYQEWLEHGGKR